MSRDNNSFIASSSDLMRRAMQNRKLIPDVPHLKPIIDTLPAGSVVCEVGCGAGGITLDIAQLYPHITVLGMDVDEESIKVRILGCKMIHNLLVLSIAGTRSQTDGWNDQHSVCSWRCMQSGQACRS
jgi:tRNA G46 methylase TrmB